MKTVALYRDSDTGVISSQPSSLKFLTLRSDALGKAMEASVSMVGTMHCIMM